MALEPVKRLSNIEALRIIALVMVIGVHVSSLGETYAPVNGLNWLSATMISVFSRFGVDIFVLIASYFMCSKMLDLKGIARRWWLLIYPVMVLTLILFLFAPPVSIDEVAQYVGVFLLGTGGMGWHGVWFGQLWYIFPFMLLVALSPLLNHAIKSMSRERHKAAVLTLALIFVGIPTVNAFATKGFLFSINDTNTNLSYFVTLYFVAAYIRKYDISIAPLKGIGISISLWLAAVALMCVYTFYVPNSTQNSNGFYDLFQGNNTAFIFTGAVFLFLSFKSFNLNNSGISFTGKLTYEAYVFHTVVQYLLSVYWPDTTSAYMPVIDYVVMVLAAIALITIASLGYGLLRYGMDRALIKLAKVSGISGAGSSAVNWLMSLRTGRGPPTDKSDERRG
jgi:surface polysaccharide O-acyltransferase-like enzyme